MFINTLRIILRDVLIPLYNYQMEEIGDNDYFNALVDCEEIFYGVTDFLTSLAILYLFYVYGNEYARAKPKPKNLKLNLPGGMPPYKQSLSDATSMTQLISAPVVPSPKKEDDNYRE